MFVVVAYDISHNRRRTRLAKILLDYGERVQESVFEAEVPPDLFAEMIARAQDVIDATEDTVRFYTLSRRSVREVRILGQGELHRPEPVYVF